MNKEEFAFWIGIHSSPLGLLSENDIDILWKKMQEYKDKAVEEARAEVIEEERKSLVNILLNQFIDLNMPGYVVVEELKALLPEFIKDKR